MKKNFFLIYLVLFFFTSCEKELEFKYHDIESVLVIEGMLSKEGVSVSLTATTPMDEKIERDCLPDAQIYLIDCESGSRIELSADNNGIFTADYNAYLDKEYGLEIFRDGKIYISKSKMRPATEIENLMFQWIKMPYDYVAVLQISFRKLDDDDCYWIKIYRNSEPYKWIVSDNRGAVGGIITEVTFTTRKDLEEEDEKDILREGDEIEVIINTVSREMYDYLIAIENDSNGPSMFEGDFCLGYFMASDSVKDSIIFHPDEIQGF